MDYNKVSLFIIGSELTRGVIKDGHGQLVSHELSNLGYEIRRIIIVPDDGNIFSQLNEYIKDSDLIIFTGGLGPTCDDLTRSVIAKSAKVPLEKNQEAWDELYKRVGDKIYGANESQTLIPQGFVRIPNPKGTAPGFRGFITRDDGHKVLCMAMPGPPVEMQEMLYHQILPYIAKLKGGVELGRTEFSSFLTPESRLEEVCQKCRVGNVEWGTRFQNLRISLYLTGGTSDERKLMGENLKKNIGKNLLVDGDQHAMDMLIDLLKEKEKTVSTAESCTAGWLAKLFTDKSGSSSWYWGGVVSYADEAKTKLLNVNLDNNSAVSIPTAIAMAEGILKSSNSDFGLSITGYAGPTGGDKDNPVGTVIFGFAGKGMKSQAVSLKFNSYTRDSIRKRAVVASSILALEYIRGASLLDIVCDWQYI